MAYASINPYNGDVLQTYDNPSDSELETVLATAHSAFQSWRTTSFEVRAALVRRIGELFVERAGEIGYLMATEMGKVTSPDAMSMTGTQETQFVSTIFTYYADNAAAQLAPERRTDATGNTVLLTKEPLGVIFAVEPWNYPIYQVARVIAPQFMAGNPVILKHASNVPQTALAIEQVVRDAGAPEGLFTNVFATHDQVAQIIADFRVRGVALTGSEKAGATIAAQAGAALKKSTLELGGADPFIVLDDADVDLAAKFGAANRLENSGQMCIASKRFFIHESVYDEFVDKYRDNAAAYTPGDPLDAGTTLAPLSSQAQADEVNRQAKQAIDAGATYEAIGKPVPEFGAFVQPAILTNVAPDNPVYYQEIFGPVAMFFPIKDDDDAIRLANDSPFGLSGSVFSADPQHAKRVADQIDTGMVNINSAGASLAEIPFGGIKNSGYGRELSDLGITEFVNYKWVTDVDEQ